MHGPSHNSVVILGAGPTGLGAAHRLAEIGEAGVQIFDENNSAKLNRAFAPLGDRLRLSDSR